MKMVKPLLSLLILTLSCVSISNAQEKQHRRFLRRNLDTEAETQIKADDSTNATKVTITSSPSESNDTEDTSRHIDDGVFIYEYPAAENQTVDDLLDCMMNQHNKSDPRIDSSNWHGGYPPEDIAEYYLHEQLKQSFRKTDDPSKATFFIVNVSPVLSSLAGVCNGKGHWARQLHYKELLETSEQFHERPIDHAFICQTWRCGHLVRPILKPLVKDMSYLIHENNDLWIGIEDYDMEKTIMVPYVAHSEIKEFTHLPPTDAIRKHRVTFCGSLKRRSRFREVISEVEGVHLNSVPDINLGLTQTQEEIIEPYHQTMRDSTFCLVPEGDTPSSRRLFDSMMSGCIPVFITWGYDRPFENVVDYDSFSINLNAKRWLNGEAQDQIDELYAMTEDEILEKRENLAKYVNYINWREGSNVVEGIVDAMMHRRQGKQVVHTIRE